MGGTLACMGQMRSEEKLGGWNGFRWPNTGCSGRICVNKLRTEALWRWCVVKMTNLLTLSIICLWSKTHDVSETGVVSPSSRVRLVEFYLNESTVWVSSYYLLRVICDWFSSYYLPRVYFVLLFIILYDLTTSVVRRQGVALSIGPNRVGVFYLTTETDSSLRNVVCFWSKIDDG
jgi:hypothetical protein